MTEVTPRTRPLPQAHAGSTAALQERADAAVGLAVPERDREGVQLELPPALVEELGRILGEALIKQFQQDRAVMVKPPWGSHRSA